MMIKVIKNLKLNGFTFIQMISSIIMISVVMLSLMTISGEVLHHFNREFVREDLQNYIATQSKANLQRPMVSI